MGKFVWAIILAAIVIFFSLSTFAQEVLDVEIPPPPEGRPLDVGSEKITIGARELNCFYYLTPRTKDDTVVFYQRFFRDQGFKSTLDKNLGEDFKGQDLRSIFGKEISEYLDSLGQKETLDVKIVSLKWLRFKKEGQDKKQELVADLIIYDKSDGTHVSIGKYLQPFGSADIDEGLPSIQEIKELDGYSDNEDAPGEDIEVIPRPADSTRWGSLRLGRTTMLTYASSLAVDELREFYKNQMSYLGWQIVRETAVGQALDSYKRETYQKKLKMGSLFRDGEDLSEIISQAYILDFRGQKGKASITVYPNFMDKKSGSVAQINYEEPG